MNALLVGDVAMLTPWDSLTEDVIDDMTVPDIAWENRDALLVGDYRISRSLSTDQRAVRADHRIRKQADLSTVLGLSLLDELLERLLDRCLVEGTSMDRDRIGVFITSQFGGMRFAEPELAGLIKEGPRRVSAYQSIAWFYAATQGQWTIQQGVHAYAKSFCGDVTGLIDCLETAWLALSQKRASVAFLGAVDCLADTQFAQGIRCADSRSESGSLSDGGAFLSASLSATQPQRCALVRSWGRLPLTEVSDSRWERLLRSIGDRQPLVLIGNHQARLGYKALLMNRDALQRSRLLPSRSLDSRLVTGNAMSGSMATDLALGAALVMRKGGFHAEQALVLASSRYGHIGYVCIEKHPDA